MNNDVDGFLKKIAQIESSNGANFEHKEIKSGLQKGQTAIGTFGLLPNTVDEVIARSKDPDLAPLADMNAKQQKAYLEANPDMEHKVAEHLAEHVLEKQGGDQEKAAYSWLYGHNLSPASIEKRDYQEDPYVQKFNKVQAQMGMDRSKLPIRSVAAVPKQPMDIGGTPEGDKLQTYLESSPSQDARDLNMKQKAALAAMFDKQKADQDRAIDIASRSPFADTTPEERKFSIDKLGLAGAGIVQGGPGMGAPAAISKAADTARPVAMNAYRRIQAALGRSPMTPAEFVLKQSKNPDVMETLKDIRKYASDVPGTEGREAIDQLANQQQSLRELEPVQDLVQKNMNVPTPAAQFAEETTLTPEQLMKMKGK